MHREISHTDELFHEEHNLSLYLLTGLMGLLIVLDVWPKMVSWFGWSALPTWPTTIYGQPIALIAAVIGGARILYTSLESLFEGRLGADLALAIATIAAILINEPLVAAEVVFIGLVGECLESFTFERTQRAIRKIVEVCPRRCWLLRDGQEVRVRTTELQVGDVVVVKPGARIPVDGEVLDGRSAVDTSALTGEALPVDKVPGDEVLAGSLNQFGALTIRADRVAEHTVVGRVIELTSRALKNKANIERTADRMARYFLPIVLGLAAVTFLGAMFYYTTSWFRAADAVRLGWNQAIRLSTYPTLSVLVVACPCALILATPAAIIAALGRLAGTGVLIKGGGALERLAGVSAFAFDKTGTLTEGRLNLGDVVGLHGIDESELLRIAASAEQRSEHLIAQLILNEAKQRRLEIEPVEEFQAHPGAGVSAKTAGSEIVVGNRRLLEEQGIAIGHEVNNLLQQFDEKGQTALMVARDAQIIGVIGARDHVRPEAAGIIEDLRNHNISDIALLTGDRLAVANNIAKELAIDDVHAGILPEQKAEIVARMRQGAEEKTPKEAKKWWQIETSLPGHVAMVGDGINDAPALASADVGLAIGGSGTDVAAEAGDVVFMGDPLKPLPLLLRLSRETVRIIRQNILIFAFGVNFLGILLTSWLWPVIAPAAWYEQSPIAAVIYHQLGSLAVLLNSMRILWFERTSTSPFMQRMGRFFKDVDHWMEKYLDVGEGIHWLEHQWKPVTAVLVLLLCAGYALSGFTQIGPDEKGIACQFGKPVADLEPGLHYRWPWPIEKVVRIKPDQIRTVEIGFRAAPGMITTQTMSWISQHAGQGIRKIPEEAMMHTGDDNLTELQATVRYKVTDPHTYLFEVSDPDALVRAAAEDILRNMVATTAFTKLLTTDRAKIQNDALAKLTQRCQSYGANGLGIHLDGLSLHDLHPPQEVVQSYYEVTKAMKYGDKLINDAKAYKYMTEANAEAKAARMKNDADAYHYRKVSQAEAYKTAFETFSKAHQKNKSLTEFRLFWEAVKMSFKDRDLVLIDAENIPGKRHLFLLDPEQLQTPVPILMQPGSQLPPPSKFEGEHADGP